MKRSLFCVILVSFVQFSPLCALQDPNREDLAFGVARVDVDSRNGDFKRSYGIFIDSSTIITSAHISKASFPKNISIFLRDDSSNLVLCVAKASLTAHNDDIAILTLTNYTDDYCNPSPKKYYHKYLIENQKIDIFGTATPNLKNYFTKNNEFLFANQNKTIARKHGMAYFDDSGALVGIASSKKIINLSEIRDFVCEVANIELISNKHCK